MIRYVEVGSHIFELVKIFGDHKLSSLIFGSCNCSMHPIHPLGERNLCLCRFFATLRSPFTWWPFSSYIVLMQSGMCLLLVKCSEDNIKDHQGRDIYWVTFNSWKKIMHEYTLYVVPDDQVVSESKCRMKNIFQIDYTWNYSWHSIQLQY